MLKFLQSIVLLSSFLLLTTAGNAQGRQVTGTILSQNDNSPLPGVTVTNRNTNQSTTTNANGTFTINADRGHVLLLSYVGYMGRQITVGDDASLNVTLAPNQNSMGEVVVTAHGINRNRKTLG